MRQFKAPSIIAAAGESFTPLEFGRLLAAIPILSRQARGRGEPVIVLPGFGATNTSTYMLRCYLSWLGYSAQGWSMGRNEGDVQQLLPHVVDQVRQVHRQSGSKVNIIGWSLGGVIAREVARDTPGAVRQVITMGSPIVGGPKYTSLGGLVERSGVDLDEMEANISAHERSKPILVPVTSIYSKNDGVVSWQASIDRHSPHIEHFEVYTTHLGLGISPDVYMIIAESLAQS